MADGKLRPRDAKVALLVFEDQGSIDFFQATSSGAYIHDIFGRGEAQIKLVDNSGYGSVLPSLVRVHSHNHSRFFYRRSWSGSSDTKATTELYRLLVTTIEPDAITGTKKKSKHPFVYAAVIFLVILLAITFWSGWQSNSSSLPMFLAESNDGSIIAASQHNIYFLDNEGALKQTIAFSELGFNGGISEIEYFKNEEWLIGDGGEGLIKKCDMQKRICQALPKSPPGMFTRSFKFAVDKQSNRIFVADTAQHRLVVISTEGELLAEIANRGDGLCFPNDPLIINNKLFVANTNYHEIVVWDILSENYLLADKWLTVKQGRSDVDCPMPEPSQYLAFFARERSKSNGDRAIIYEYSRQGRVWPYVLAHVDNHLWVINGGDNLSSGDIIQFEDKLNLKSELIPFDENTDPVMILPRKSDVLIAEIMQGFIRRVDLDGNDLGIFGDERFQNEINQIRNKMEKMETISAYGKIGLVVFLVMLITLLLLFRKYRIKQIIDQDPAFEKKV
ncbi:MAG: hypothetical protein COB77_02300 [Gammaproteobacteria bacterium]|nr:MAG: hypothetical protein COB77_02300 [Gammaproteobacteria bacterium]